MLWLPLFNSNFNLNQGVVARLQHLQIKYRTLNRALKIKYRLMRYALFCLASTCVIGIIIPPFVFLCFEPIADLYEAIISYAKENSAQNGTNLAHLICSFETSGAYTNCDASRVDINGAITKLCVGKLNLLSITVQEKIDALSDKQFLHFPNLFLCNNGIDILPLEGRVQDFLVEKLTKIISIAAHICGVVSCSIGAIFKINATYSKDCEELNKEIAQELQAI